MHDPARRRFAAKRLLVPVARQYAGRGVDAGDGEEYLAEAAGHLFASWRDVALRRREIEVVRLRRVGQIRNHEPLRLSWSCLSETQRRCSDEHGSGKRARCGCHVRNGSNRDGQRRACRVAYRPIKRRSIALMNPAALSTDEKTTGARELCWPISRGPRPRRGIAATPLTVRRRRLGKNMVRNRMLDGTACLTRRSEADRPPDASPAGSTRPPARRDAFVRIACGMTTWPRGSQ